MRRATAVHTDAPLLAAENHALEIARRLRVALAAGRRIGLSRDARRALFQCSIVCMALVYGGVLHWAGPPQGFLVAVCALRAALSHAPTPLPAAALRSRQVASSSRGREQRIS